jgi:hypothetical protein
MDENIDDSIFQNKIKDKVTPNPQFLYYTISFIDKIFGIIEILVKKYPEPLSPTQKMYGLEPGKIYTRSGSTNSEANGREVIAISKWMESLPNDIEEKSLSIEINQLLTKIASTKYQLSECITLALNLAEKFKLQELKEFCKAELTGFGNKETKAQYESISHRITRLIDKKAFIPSMTIPSTYNEEKIDTTIKNIGYFIAFEDSTNDKKIDESVFNDLYISDLNGKNLVQVTKGIDVIEFSFINHHKDIFISYTDRTDIQDEYKMKKFASYNIKMRELSNLTGIERALNGVQKILQ